jgi:site-specific DNA recombinase
MNIRAIVHQLSQEQVPTKIDRHKTNGRKESREGRWHASSIYHILRNETYVGTMYWNKRQAVTKTRWQYRDRTEWLSIPVLAIIAPETFAAVQQRLTYNGARSKRNRKHEYLFAGGRLRCGRCGASMIGYSAKNTLRYRCYSQFMHHPGEPFCRGNVRAEDIEPLVWREIEHVLSDPRIIMEELDRQEHQGATTQHDMTKETQVIQKALAALEREVQRWDAAYAGEVISLTELKAKKLDITERRQRLLAQQEAVDAAMHAAHAAQAKTRDILTYCLQIKEQLDTLDMPHKRLALEALDIRVTWAPDEPIHIAGSIPLDIIVSNALRCAGTHLARRTSADQWSF